MRWVWDEGSHGGACFCRAVVIITGRPYREVFGLIDAWAQHERPSDNQPRRSSAASGVYGITMRRVMADLGYEWVSFMRKGVARPLLGTWKMPRGRIIIRIEGHVTAAINGEIHDIRDPDLDARRRVLGYWRKKR